MHKQECLDDGGDENRYEMYFVAGCMTNSPKLRGFAIDWPCINENWASCAGKAKGEEKEEEGQRETTATG